MSPYYDVFICHRGPDTKRNIVSVLSGMLSCKGITSFVDYEMPAGSVVNRAIEEAIKRSSVHIVIFSPEFEKSTWCLDEVDQIMNIQSSPGTSNIPRKVIPIFCDVQRSEVLQRAVDSEYDLKHSTTEEIKRWAKAVRNVCEFGQFEYSSQTMCQWEKLQEVVVEVEAFIKKEARACSSLSYQDRSHQGRKPAQGYDVFICYVGEDTKRNMVSVLRGRLHSMGITCFDNYNMNHEPEINPHIEEAIKKSKAYVIFFSKNFASSKRCLEEAKLIMNMQCPSSTSSRTRKVIPIFYDVPPSEVRHQPENSEYHQCRVTGSTVQEGDQSWSKSLYELSKIKGFEFRSENMFQWEELEKIVKEVKLSLKEQTHGSFYSKQIDEVQMFVESKKKSEDVSLVGVYGPNKSQFVELLIQKLLDEFDRVCSLSNLMEEASKENWLLHVLGKVYSDPTRLDSHERLLVHGSHYEQILQRKRCLVVIDVVGNDLYQTRELLERLKSKLMNGSVVVLTSEFKHMLKEVMNVDELIELQESKGTLIICYRKGVDVHEAFLDHVQETFCMYGLEVRLLSKDELLSHSESTRNAKAIVCIISKGFSIAESETMLSDLGCSKILYILYGRDVMNESPSNSNCLRINFEESELNKMEFKTMVNEAVGIFRRGNEKTSEVIDFPIGLEERVHEISTHMGRSGSSVQCFGLVGMGGVGKTTIAKSVYNRLHVEFEKACFCLSTRAKGLVDMQKKLLCDLFGETYKGMDIEDVEHGKRMLKEKLKGINALIVLDDVDTGEQVEALYFPLCSLGRESIVIITSRDNGVVKLAQPKKIFDVKEFANRKHSERLFYWHAFLKPEPPPHLKEVSGKVIDACGGLPLSLEVIGAHLYQYNDDDDERTWNEALRYLKEVGKKIFRALRISFDGLDRNEREAFLDICCFLIGRKEETVCRFFESCYGIGRTYIRVLKSKCLITIEKSIFKERLIGMHDHLRDMGRAIIQDEERNRVWDEESAQDILKDESALSTLRGLSIRSDCPFPKEAGKCTSLPNLRILEVKVPDHDTTISQGLCANKILENMRCDGLRWLKWRNAKFHDLPDGLCCSTYLRVLDLRGSSNLTSVRIASLSNLQHLDLSDCTNLTSVRIASLSNLQHLNLSHCLELKHLPEEIARCEFLTSLPFLPTTLKDLDLTGCSSFRSLKASLPKLERLHLGACEALETAELDADSMRVLDLERCRRLKEVDCTGLRSLEHLNLKRCESLTSLPFLPTALKHLDLTGCSSFRSLKASLPKLEELHLWGCEALETAELDVDSMRVLGLSYCRRLKEVDCTGLRSLEQLYLEGCESLTTFAFLPTTPKELNLNWCSSFRSLKASLPKLEELHLRGCEALETAELDADCRRLKELDFAGCRRLKELDCTAAVHYISFLELVEQFKFCHLRMCMRMSI
ncbi:hypothetical protein KP509_1Z238100 [Ceratopteris richardii]|nr:hypothetical protein KP509_1Z238100 [Ceratopteris richardii]